MKKEIGEYKFCRDIEGYRRMLEEIRQESEKQVSKKPIPIRNDSFEHAVVLTSDIIRHVEENGTICILSTALCRPFYTHEEIESALCDANNKNAKIRILVRKDGRELKDVIDNLKKTIDNVEVKIGSVKIDDLELNDFVVAGEGFRYELAHPETENYTPLHDCDDGKYDVNAVGALRDPESVKKLKKLFEQSFKATSIQA